MIVYVLATSLSALLAYLLRIRRSSEINPRRLAIYVPLIPLVIVSVLRYQVGLDTFGQWSIYPVTFGLIASGDDYAAVQQSRSIEPGYFFINKLVAMAGGDLQWVIVIMSLIFLCFMYKYLLENSENIPLSLVLLFASDLFMFSLTGLRQAAATAIVFWALRYANRRRWWLFFFWLALACTLHITALLFLPLYVLRNRRASVGVVIGLVAAGLLLSLVPGALRSAIGVFYGSQYFGSKWDYSNFNVIPALASALVVVFALTYQRRLTETDRRAQVLINISVANFFLMMMSAGLITPIRLYYLLIPAAFVLIPAVIRVAGSSGRVRALLIGLTLTFAVSGQLVYELVSGNDAYGTWQYNWILGG